MNISQTLIEQADSRPDAPAITDYPGGRERTQSFREIERASARVATLLAGEGVRPGDRVLVLQPMSAELYIALAALFRLGLTALFLDPSAGREHIARCCGMAPPRVLIGSARAHLLCLLVPELRRIPCKVAIGGPPLIGTVPWSRERRQPAMEGFEACGDNAPALITFTSGSTGRPKAAQRTHGFLLAQRRAIEQTIGLTASTVEMATLPVFALVNLAAGIHTVIPDVDLRAPGKVDPAPVLACVDRFGPARIIASPAFLERIADRCVRDGRTLPSFQQIATGGAPVFPLLLDKLHSVAPQAEIIAVYGSTEAEPIAEISRAAITPTDRAGMLGGRGLLAGHPVPVVDLRIMRACWGAPVGPFTREQFEAECVGAAQPRGVAAASASVPNSVGVAGDEALACGVGAATDDVERRAQMNPGEIVVSGDHVLQGYLNGEGDEETKFQVDGRVWHRTGDTGYLDGEGRLWLLGRCSATVTDARGTLYPFAVECAAQHRCGVRRAALLSRAGQRVLAIETESGAAVDTDALRAALSWAQLDRLVTVREIPVDKRHNAKVDYTALDRIV